MKYQEQLLRTCNQCLKHCFCHFKNLLNELKKKFNGFFIEMFLGVSSDNNIRTHLFGS
jgi:hypothetical protein